MREISLDASTYLHNPNDRLALIGAAETSSQGQEGNGMQELQELAEKARRTGKMEDKLSYVNAKRALENAEASK
ncbi:hypothetical protein ASG97_00155 [Bacillus sp. Soil745]|nr:hypothetical protein ASG97_00155 [Bacillus sp. Soil745]